MRKLMKKVQSKKGFTLVEVIVVLVILAILAAVLIPSLTGYIDKANEKALTSECRSVVVAAQTLTSEAYGAGISDVTDSNTIITLATIKALAEVTDTNVKIAVAVNEKTHKVSKVQYCKNGKICTYSVKTTPKYIVTTAVAVTEALTSVTSD